MPKIHILIRTKICSVLLFCYFRALELSRCTNEMAWNYRYLERSKFCCCNFLIEEHLFDTTMCTLFNSKTDEYYWFYKTAVLAQKVG